METIELLPISSIVKNPYQPRIVFDEEKLQEL
ncbi:MAG: chromosome partitioning protein ParB, partial [Lactococcus sp.]|nr:chromosome partitioning protein ParB [Lactococcus sp.]MDN6108680.1 chromosome partitioning protein ParB [Lactococcus sp.]